MDVDDGSLGAGSSLALSGTDALHLLSGVEVPKYCHCGGNSGPTFAKSIHFAEAELPAPPFTVILMIRASPSGDTFRTFAGWGVDSTFDGADFRLTPAGNLE